MTKLHKKLLVVFCALVCMLCLCLGVTACNKQEHTHTFDGLWLFDGEEGHYQLATCHHTVKSELEPHFDGNGDKSCDVCGFDMSEKGGEHEHEYSEQWSFNELRHWHNATCEHFTERSSYDYHNFVAGVCECGIKESEVKVYALYKNSPEYELYFPQWLEWLESNGITVEYTENGDGVYHYADGRSEVRFLGERTVMVKALADGAPLSEVWFMVTMYQPSGNGYFESNGTIALGIAKTDSNGVAEITFNPVGGFSSAKVEYRIRIAERKDIAVFEGVMEEDASLPIPNRYEVEGGKDGFEFEPYEITQNTKSDGIAVTVNFNYSKGWNAYNKIYLPYRRYWIDQVNGKDIREEGLTYTFTTSGDNLFDYLYFSPQLYDYSQGGTEEANLKIVENAKAASQGIYRISFRVSGSANVSLVFWDEEGVQLGAYHQTNSDGTPSNRYITAQSGGTAGSGTYSGGDFVEVKITTGYGLRIYQLGLKSDSACEVTVTVQRLGDGDDKYVFEWDEEAGRSEISGIIIEQDTTIYMALNGVPAGTYVFVGPEDNLASGMWNRMFIWTDTDEQKIKLRAPKSLTDVRGEYRAVITVTDETKYIYLSNNLEAYKNITCALEKYAFPAVKANEYSALAVTPTDDSASYTSPLELQAGTYTINCWLCYNKVKANDIPVLTIYIGGNEYTSSDPSEYKASSAFFYTYTVTVTIGEGDTAISLRSTSMSNYRYMAGVMITPVTD